MRTVVIVFTGLVFLLVLSASLWAAPAPEEILDAALTPPPGTTFTASAEMTRYLSSGKIRVSAFTVKRKVTESSDKLLIQVSTDPDGSKDVFLSVTTGRGSARATKRWYWRAAKKSVTELDQKKSAKKFLGSDFSFSELDRKHEGLDDFQLLGKPILDGVNCYLIEASAARGKKKAAKARFWVRVEDPVLVKYATYNKKEREEQFLKAGNIKKFGELAFAEKWEKRINDQDEYTVVNFKDVRFGEELDDRLFEIETYSR